MSSRLIVRAAARNNAEWCDTFCRTHDVDNLFVVDASFFPSSGAVNPGLTIVAQALRVADHIKSDHLGLAAEDTPEP